MPADTPYAGVAAIFRSAIARGEAPRVFEDGAQVRDFVHVHDIARANVLAIEQVADARAGPDAVQRRVGHDVHDRRRWHRRSRPPPEARTPVLTGDYRAFDVRHVVASPEAARAGLGFEAEISPQDGLAALATDPLRTR